MPVDVIHRKRIAIFEDDPANRERLTTLVAGCGGNPVPVEPPAPELEEIPGFLDSEKVNLALCDNRLSERPYANYYGAEAAREIYLANRGAVLITAYEKEDVELSIREHRRWIPALLESTDLQLSALADALVLADREAREHSFTPQRVAYRTVMTVIDIVAWNQQAIVKVVMGQWDPDTQVGFPLKMVPEELRQHIKPESLLIAQVNVGAQRGEDLFFDDFELPDAEILRESETLLNGT